MSSQEVLPLSTAAKIASNAIQPSTPNSYHDAIELSQATHRINLLNTTTWSSHFRRQGSRILEIGCGQGTCTQVLAEAVGPSGHIDAVDPAPLDYGAPFTLGQAQSHLSSGPLGSHISWHQADPVAFLTASSPETKWDVAVLAHCIWYFKSPSALTKILEALNGRVTGAVCVAEYALHATETAAAPHVLATLARSTFEAHRADSTENIQTVLSPAAIKEIAAAAGWKLAGEDTVIPERGLSDGQWEAMSVVASDFVSTVDKEILDERVKAVLTSARDATIAAVEGVGGMKEVRTMDVWVAALVQE
ncbi:hypothetical protein B0H66DRAFT_72058 [Apodospora peruviana]|uniref:Methyltransferase domain-containing protein n=1 Tax=Apodospora peruviana TaxID=516989 RepID=A0AAE0ITE3_9PEZI|nr:hypothetical protein B0H66DRAFT_72058 [Apodospora peruviana]